jgi:hypothetical protein
LKDEAALTERLRQLGSDGSHVQTLAIPILSSNASRGGNGSLLGRKREKGEAEVGCDPAVFAEQIRIYLQRAAVERRAQASEAAARAMTAGPSASDDAAALEDMPSFILADELDVDSLELTTIPPPAPPAPDPPPPAAAAPTQSAAVTNDSPDRRGKATQKTALDAAVEEELGLVTPPAAGPPLWRVTESIEDFYTNAESFDGGGQSPAPTASAVAPPEPQPIVPAAKPQPPAIRAQRPRRTPPQPDDWAYFDPSQSEFKALIRRLDEIAGVPA